MEYFVLRMAYNPSTISNHNITHWWHSLEGAIEIAELYNRTRGIGGRYFVAHKNELSLYGLTVPPNPGA
jgi:hypothetical protein